MLKREEAQAELEKLQNKGWLQDRIGGADRLPGNLRETARTLIKLDSDSINGVNRVKRRKEIGIAVQNMDDQTRLQFFETLAPGMGKFIEGGWQLFERIPYQTGFDRKPFRAPGDAGTLRYRRMSWLAEIIPCIGLYGKSITWFAAWAPHLGYSEADQLGILLAAAIDAGGAEGEEVFQIICDSGRNEHEIGGMGRHVIRSLITANKPEGWQFIENMLLAAQREEGLRQTILESIDEGHPQVFRRMLRLIIDKKLARFSATVRALDTWLGYQWDAVSVGVVNDTIEKLLVYLEDPTAREAALNGKDSEQVYLALWSHAFDDAMGSLKLIEGVLKHPRAEHRYAAIHLLNQLGLVESQALSVQALDDPDLRVATCALRRLGRGAIQQTKKMGLFERIEKLAERYPEKPEKLKPAIWPWVIYTVSKELAADLLADNLDDRSPTRLIPHLPHMSTRHRAHAIRLLGKQPKWTDTIRNTIFGMLGDASPMVRDAVFDCLKQCKITPEEALAVEKLLDRKTGDLRRGALSVLAQQSDKCVMASADRLLASKSQPQRLAGLELLRQLAEIKRCVAEVRQRGEKYRDAHPKLTEADRQQLDVLLNVGQEVPSLQNCLGLLDHSRRTWSPQPTSHNIQLHSPSAPKIVAAVQEWMKTNAQQIVSFLGIYGEEWKGLFAEWSSGLSYIKPHISAQEHRKHIPLADELEKWWLTRGKELIDNDGMEILRTLAWMEFRQNYDRAERFAAHGGVKTELSEALKTIFGDTFLKRTADDVSLDGYHRMQRLQIILTWLLRLHPPTGAIGFALDASDSALALVPKSTLQMTPKEAAELNQPERVSLTINDWQINQKRYDKLKAKTSWRQASSPYGAWLEVLENLSTIAPELWTPPLRARYWRMLRWVDQPIRPQEAAGDSGITEFCCLPRERARLNEVAIGFSQNAATEADVIEHLIGSRPQSSWNGRHFDALALMSKRKLPVQFQFDFLLPIVDRCRKRILEVEFTRGDNPTAASGPALCLSFVEGVDNMVAILRTLGKRNFRRGWSRDSESMEDVMSHLARCCFPAKNETAEDFSRKIKAANISEERLVELALYAPQWASFVEHALGWPSLTEGVWWIHAHTKGEDWRVDKEIREIWDADMNARTTLSPSDLLEGAVDVAWFNRVYKALGPKRWNALHEAARFASTGAGHARARLFADAMLDNVSKNELVDRITKKRHQDAVRSLGLLPLADGAKREADVLTRYKVIQEFRRGSKQFGSQRQASEKRAAQIGQANLARTAGYPDPIRLEWAMEAKAVEDLGDGPIEAVVEGVKVSLGIDAWGEVEWSITKDGKTLNDIPAKLKKNPKIVALRERKVELKRQASRIRPSLEQFMVRGDEFSGTELRELMEHPLLAPMLKNLVIIGEGIKGFPIHDGKALEDHRGKVEAIKAKEKLRIAHPLDLLPVSEWHAWQKDCFARERIQPFKQVFRELYPPTETEKKEATQTSRYAGHQVQPRQALALLGQRGWVFHPEEGVRKVFHDAGIVAWLQFEEGGFTPAEIEGLTLGTVHFTKRDDTKHIKLTDLPPRLFSEAMRDLDLVVSVAHRGGVDPEASASTVEMRATLVEQTAQLLKLKNVRIKDRYALVKGQLGEYSVHLGSAVTRKMPGEMLFLIPVHSQHRGRLFLPFADDDPRTAEVMTKVLLLARDNEIKDPNILDQIR